MGAEVKSMEVKKPQQSTAAAGNVFSFKRAREFVADIKSEIQKITWTTREELMVYTKIVVGATFAFGMAIYFLDIIIQTVLGSLSYFLHLISG